MQGGREPLSSIAFLKSYLLLTNKYICLRHLRILSRLALRLFGSTSRQLVGATLRPDRWGSFCRHLERNSPRGSHCHAT